MGSPLLHMLGQFLGGGASSLFTCYGVLLLFLDLPPGGVAQDMLQCPEGQPENLGGGLTCYPHSGET